MVRYPDDFVKTHKRVKRSGWWVAGIADPESVAEHSFRAALLGYILASLEGADPQKTAMICLFHDMGEARINDLHRVAKRYIDVGNREEVAFEEQAERPPQPLAGHVVAFMHEYERRTSIEGQLAHDADLLECVNPGARIPGTKPHRRPRSDHQLLRRFT